MQPWFTSSPFLHLINFKEVECYHAARFEKGSRYYVLRLSKDLLEDWVITLINGRIKSRLGQTRTLAFADFNEGLDAFCALAKLRTLRGYTLITIACDNPLMIHFLPFVSNTQNNNELIVTKIDGKKSNLRSLPNQKTSSLLSNIPHLAAPQQLGFSF
jgi:hypothetical protein